MDFHEMRVCPAVYEDVAAEYGEIEAAFCAAGSADGRVEALKRWNRLRVGIETWGALVHVHFTQDTGDEERKRARDAFDELRPRLTELQMDFTRKLLASPHRPELEQRLGAHLFALWEAMVTTFDPAIKEELVKEARLCAQYTELLASAEFEYMGETHNLSTLRKFAEHKDREVRRGADQVLWAWFDQNGETLDRIFDDLVKLRTAMAKKLGFASYVELGYRRMLRTDYGRAEVEAFRDAVRAQLVPLCAHIRERQAEALGIDRMRHWDEALHDPEGNPAPRGDHDWLIERAKEMFDSMGGGLGEFFRLMVDRHLLDLKARPGKAGGGYCTDLVEHGVPFIFANFNGTKGDVQVFTHEMGHAFQAYTSRDQFPIDFLWPTAEACEIHSMGLEYLTWPHMENFFLDEAERFRKVHLTGSLVFLPYGVAVDHFQHEIYENPDATPQERHAMWKRMEETYLPWRDYGGMGRGEQGGLWQRQLHVYVHPFYYIDYTLASLCALQLWVRSESDREQTLEDYVALCRRGGEAPFTELVKGAGLTSPFEPGCLTDVVAKVRQKLAI